MFSYVQCVVSSSSRRGEFIPWTGDFGRVIKSIVVRAKTTEFRPFLREEFLTYKNLFPDKYQLRDKDYYALTHYNPSLLAVIDGLDLNTAIDLVKAIIRKAVDGFVATLKSNEFVLIQRSLFASIDMLVYAANSVSLPIDPLLSEYTYTWVYAESITYISDTSEENFTLSMNFPTCLSIVQEMLYDYRNVEGIKVHSSTIAEYQFELLICSAICRLDVLYSKKDEAVGHQPDGENIVFKFKGHISKQDSGLLVSERLKEDTLVYLRPCHPVIDAVAYVTTHGIPWLLFIQVSHMVTTNQKQRTFIIKLLDVK